MRAQQINLAAGKSPGGFRNTALGCGGTRGLESLSIIYPKGLRNPFGVWNYIDPFSRGSLRNPGLRCGIPLGFFWDSFAPESRHPDSGLHPPPSQWLTPRRPGVKPTQQPWKTSKIRGDDSRISKDHGKCGMTVPVCRNVSIKNVTLSGVTKCLHEITETILTCRESL